jgi:hypothetical protein
VYKSTTVALNTLTFCDGGSGVVACTVVHDSSPTLSKKGAKDVLPFLICLTWLNCNTNYAVSFLASSVMHIIRGFKPLKFILHGIS